MYIQQMYDSHIHSMTTADNKGELRGELGGGGDDHAGRSHVFDELSTILFEADHGGGRCSSIGLGLA